MTLDVPGVMTRREGACELNPRNPFHQGGWGAKAHGCTGLRDGMRKRMRTGLRELFTLLAAGPPRTANPARERMRQAVRIDRLGEEIGHAGTQRRFAFGHEHIGGPREGWQAGPTRTPGPRKPCR